MTKHKLMLAAAVLALSVTAGTSYAMQGMGKGMGMSMEQRQIMMQKRMDMVPELSKETKMLMGNMMKSHMESKKASFKSMKKKRDELKEIMTAEKFDRKAFIAKKAEMTAMKTKMHASKAEDMASVYEKMTTKERMAWSKKMHRGPKGKGMMQGKMRGKGMMKKSDCPMMNGSNDKK